MLTSLSLSLALGLSSSRKEGSLFSKLEKKQTDHYLQSCYKDKMKTI